MKPKKLNNKIILLLVTILILNTSVYGYYMGWDYGTNITKYKNILNTINNNYFLNLKYITFENNVCVWNKITIFTNSYNMECAKGVFLYKGNVAGIRISTQQNNEMFMIILLHELGHLQQYNNNENYTQDGADEYALIIGKENGFYN